ncbi:MAG: response regulator [Acidobacteria bacterium]|nr:MAG: response regulator [Acidobacteriota bacterium]
MTLRRYADWCLIEVVEDDGRISEVTGAHARPELEPVVTELASLPAALGEAVGLVLRSGEPYLLAKVPPTYAHSVSKTTQQLELLRALDPESLMAVPLKARGRILGVIAFVLSGSGRRYEPADLPLAEGIARRAALAIDNARLYRTSQNANRLKDEFLATLSHELRTPLNAVLGWTQLLLTHQLEGDEVDRALQTIRRNADAQAGLISDILDVSSIITGKLRLQVAPLDLRAVLDASVAAVKPAADAKHLVLDILADGCPQTMLGDADRLQQVFWNLLSNAVKFTPSGGRVTLTVTRDEDHVRIKVVDTGAGMPASFLPALFERFRQADGSATRSYGGLGLGLAIVRHLTELHGGSVHGHSDGEGLGAVFTVALPVHVSPRQAMIDDGTRATPGRETREEAPPRLDGVSALVVDDDPDSLGLVRMTLERLGAKVLEAASADAALGILECEWPDVLLADIAMPGQDGYSLIRGIRQMETAQRRHLAAVAITAYARDVDRHRAIDAGFDSYLAKPASPADVARAVAMLTGRHGVAPTGTP